MKKVKKMAFGGMSSRGPATPPAAPMRPQAAPLRGLNPQASLAKPDPLAAARAAAFRSGANLNPQTGLAAGPLQRAAQPGAIAKSQSQILDAARAAASQLTPLQRANIAHNQAQAAAAPKNFTTTGTFPSPQKFNPVSAGKLDAALGDVSAGTLFKKLAAAKPMSGPQTGMMKKGGAVKAKPKKYAKGGSVSSASKRADGIATKGKTKGRFI